jgi:hypothetical protein
MSLLPRRPVRSLALRLTFVLCLVCAPARAEDAWSALPEEWRVDALLRVHAGLDDGVGFSLPERPVRAHVILNADTERFGVSLRDADALWLLQVGALELDARGQPRLTPDDLFERGLVELACEALGAPPPCDAPLHALSVAVAESSARARVEGRELRVAGRLRLVVFDPARPGLRIRVGAAWGGRGEPLSPEGGLLAAMD